MTAETIHPPESFRDDPGFAVMAALAANVQDLHRQQVIALAPIVQNLMQNRSRSAQEIERTLDLLLDCACIPEGLALFKTLCRYYFPINPQTTATYIHSYRDLWDNEELGKEETP